MPTSGQRKLAAIMFTDIVGYSSVMQEDEARGRLLRERHRSVFEHCTNRHNGKIVQYYGDGTLSVFDSAVAAVECAVSMQQQLRTYPQVPLRIGVHLGDIHYDETEVYGHGVNLAARIEPMCNPGGIFVSGKVNDELRGHPWLKTRGIGTFNLKNIDKELVLFAVEEKDVAFPSAGDVEKAHKISGSTKVSGAAERSEAIRRFSRDKRRKMYSRLGNWAAIFLIAAMAIVAFNRWSGTQVTEVDDGRTAIAVLPFVNMSAAQENEYFADGMTEDILTLLSRIQGLSVTSRTSVMSYKGSNKTTRQIARELDVDHILEGSVRRDGDAVRVTAQLIDARNDSHIWANTYDADLTNIFDVQSQVAGDIAHHLKKTFAESDRTLFANDKEYDVTAYDLCLKGRQFYRMYTPEDNNRAIAYFNGALEIEPEFPFALAGLGDAYAQKAFHHGMDEAMLDTAVLMSARAIEADPGLSEGYKALGLAFHYMGKYDEAIVQYEKALEVDPYNDMASNNLGTIYRNKGDVAQAAKWAAKTYDLNKGVVPSSAVALADLYLSVGDTKRAGEIAEDAVRANPDATDLRIIETVVDLRGGKPGTAIVKANKVIEMEPDKAVGYDLLASAYLVMEDWESAERVFAEAIERSKSPGDKVLYEVQQKFSKARNEGTVISEEDLKALESQLDTLELHGGKYEGIVHLIRAGIDTETGEVDKAIQELRARYNSSYDDFSDVQDHPIFDPLRGNPEFQGIIQMVQRRNDSLQLVIQQIIDESAGT